MWMFHSLGNLWSTLCSTSKGIISSSNGNFQLTSYNTSVSRILGVLTAITEIEFGFSILLPFVFKIGSSTVDWQLCVITSLFIVMNCLSSVLYPILILLGLCIVTPSMKELLPFYFTTKSLSLEILLPIVVFMKHSPTWWRLLSSVLDTNLLHLINFGLGFIWLRNFSDMMLIDAPVSNRPLSGMLLIIRFYNIGVVVLTLSICTSCIDVHSHSKYVSTRKLHNCFASSSVYPWSISGLLSKSASLLLTFSFWILYLILSKCLFLTCWAVN